jgi:hypothetical protein
MTFRGFPLLPPAKVTFSFITGGNCWAESWSLATRLDYPLLRRRIQCTVEFGRKEGSIKTKQAKLKTLCNIWCSHTVLMPIQAFCNVTQFRLVTNCRRCLHLDCQVVKQRYMIQSTQRSSASPLCLVRMRTRVYNMSLLAYYNGIWHTDLIRICY